MRLLCLVHWNWLNREGAMSPQIQWLAVFWLRMEQLLGKVIMKNLVEIMRKF